MTEGAGDDGLHDQGVYVVALVGESPGVVTELLWHLAVCEARRIRGVELWTTQGSAAGLERVGPGFFAQLRRSVPDLPRFPHHLRPVEDPAAPMGDGEVLVYVTGVRDIRSRDDARCFEIGLHRRVEHLARPTERPRLVGGLSGGRKTMTASMHSAFSLHGRKGDRLCHVLVHPAIEDHLGRDEMKKYAFPTVALADVVPLDEQLSVIDIPFFAVQDYLSAQDARPGSARQLVTRMRRAVTGLRAETGGGVAFERRPRGVALNVGGRVVAPKTALAYAILVRARTAMADSTLAKQANELMAPRRGSTPNHATKLSAVGVAKTLGKLREDLLSIAAERPDVASLAPEEDHRGWWSVRPHPAWDVGALQPERLVDAWFPLETTTRARRSPRLRGS